ncbi:hypothetical protein CK215_24720 [Mesorhizobium sp. WSM3864]|nr:hypothetical protein CK215_24720 [Mesorhizobium sp. WSM3864]
MDKLPSDAAAVGLSLSIAGNAVAETIEATELLDVDVDHLDWHVALIAANRLGRFHIPKP